MMSVRGTQTVPSGELVRNFGRWQDQARDQPVFITNRGRDTHVLLSRKQYENLTNSLVPESNDQAVDASLVSLFDDILESIAIVDDDLRIIKANRAARDFSKTADDEIIGWHVSDLIPEVDKGFIRRYLLRTIRLGEHLSADIRSTATPGGWIHCQTVRVSSGAALIFRDISEDMEAHHLADIKECIVRAMEADGHVGCARLSPREMVVGADDALTSMLGVTSEALKRVKFSSVILAPHRRAFQDAMERAFAGEGPQSIGSFLLSASGGEIPVRLSIVEMRSAYASEGVVILVTRSVEAPTR